MWSFTPLEKIEETFGIPTDNTVSPILLGVKARYLKKSLSKLKIS